jgi:lipopolysaccharide/colanic/teichoic acid biosynthesis glycosyltransferase
MNVVNQNTALRLASTDAPVGPPPPAVKPGNLKVRPAPVRRLHSLHERADIEAIIFRESARCERTGHEFSLVVFDIPLNHRSTKLLGRILRERVRATDEVGWFDERRLCAVLPDTGPEGARHFVAGVTRRAHSGGLEPLCTIYAYPSAWLTPAEVSRPEDAAKDKPADDQDDPPSPKPAVQQMEQLLVRRIPFWKRLLDILVSSFMLLLLSPIFLVVAVCIKLTSRGPVFFTQRRAGLGGRAFVIFKFRTMIPDAERLKAKLREKSEQDGPAFKMERDPRVTRIGDLLRRTSLDELPQLWNVFVGDMSLVGPRPLPIDEAEACELWHRRRLDVTPGLTCIWQVKGRSRVSFADWIRMDRAYIRSRSLWCDLSLMLQTVPAVLLRKGAK